ncbi:hypothetical protein H1R20_g6056, partial [Candolleomyces eurysporus]
MHTTTQTLVNFGSDNCSCTSTCQCKAGSCDCLVNKNNCGSNSCSCGDSCACKAGECKC